MEDRSLPSKPGSWKAKIVAFASGIGAPGLFLISFLDSSVLTFPVINDLLLIELSVQHPARMPLYASMAASGSVLGCLLLFFLARKGGEVFFRRKAGARAEIETLLAAGVANEAKPPVPNESLDRTARHPSLLERACPPSSKSIFVPVQQVRISAILSRARKLLRTILEPGTRVRM